MNTFNFMYFIVVFKNILVFEKNNLENIVAQYKMDSTQNNFSFEHFKSIVFTYSLYALISFDTFICEIQSHTLHRLLLLHIVSSIIFCAAACSTILGDFYINLMTLYLSISVNPNVPQLSKNVTY